MYPSQKHRSHEWITCLTLASTVLAIFVVAPLQAETTEPSNRRQFEQVSAKAIDYLRTKGQSPDGSFSSQGGPGVTALVTTGLLRHGRGADDPTVAKALAYLKRFVRKDGGIYAEGSNHRNYETCLALLCFHEANEDGRFDKLIADAEKFVKVVQWDGDESTDIEDTAYGGFGYGSHSRPDLSNTAFAVETLHTIGNNAEDEAIKRALIFISRCQNLETEHNTTPFAAKNPDGGMYYTPAAGGTSQAGLTENGGLRSYGSMTYAGLKSMIYAGVSKDDPRVKAAIAWLRKSYTVKQNPGMGDAGLYYYYHTFAKALDSLDENEFEDADGKKHPWRQELLSELADRQQTDGSWVNENARWLEGEPNLVTGYALLALSYCKPEE